LALESFGNIFKGACTNPGERCLECWTRIGKKEMVKLEKLEGRMLKRLLQVPESTSTWGILKETGIWTLEIQIALPEIDA